MTTTIEFISALQNKGVRLSLDNEQLSIDAPKGALSAAEIEAIRQRKDSIMELLWRLELQKGIPPLRQQLTDEPAPLSFSQQRLWFIQQLDLGSYAYNMPFAVRLSGNLDRRALQLAVSAVVDRHEVLRASFVMQNGEPVQVIGRSEQFQLREVDLASLHVDERDIAVKSAAIEETCQPFDLEKGMPIRGQLLRLSDTDHVLLVTMHHIVSDGWSLGLLIREIGALYVAIRRGAPNPLPPLEIQYTDYARWQREWLQGEILERQLSDWREHLQGAPPLLELPTDRSRPLLQQYRGGKVSIVIEAELTARLRQMAAHHDATLFVTLFSAFAIFLSRLCRQNDVVVGIPVANRGRLEVEGLIGFFVNTLALRTQLTPEMTVGECLSSTNETVLSAFNRQEVPFERIVEALQPQRSLSYNPIYQVAFALQGAAQSAIELPELTLVPQEMPSIVTQFDLSLTLQESGDRIVGNFGFASDLFDSATLERWAENFRTLLLDFVRDPTRRIADLSLLSEVERRKIVKEYNATEVHYPRGACIHELFEQQAAEKAQAIAVVSEHECYTYGQLNSRANRLAHQLRQEGACVGNFVAVLMPRCIDMLVCQLAILKCGSAYVPIDPELPVERKLFLIRDCKAGIVLAQSSEPEIRRTLVVTWLDLGEIAEVISRRSHTDLNLPIDAHAPAYVMYTSGSTGLPKGVVVSHRNVTRLTINSTFAPVVATDCVAYCSNPAFDASTYEIWATLLNGARLLVISLATLLDPKEFSEFLLANQVSVLHLTTGLFNQYADLMKPVFARLRYLLFGGEAADLNIVRKVVDEGYSARLIQLYGPTETTSFATSMVVASMSSDSRCVPIGRPISNTQVYLLDERLRPVPIGVCGEIYVGGDGVAHGYLHQFVQTAERFVPDPFSVRAGTRMYRTGDLARWRSDGTIEYLGRNDFQVKIRGYRIELAEIEVQLGQHPNIKEVLVVARQDTPGEKRLVAYFTPGEAAPSVEDMRAHLKERMPEYMVPSAFVMLDRMPLTPNGKVNRQALPLPQADAFGVRQYVPPQGEIEEALAEVWRELLRLERIGRNDSFFELGGHSLLAVRLIDALQKRFEQTIPLRAFMEAPTIAEMAGRLADLSGSQKYQIEQIGPDLAGRHAPFPLTPIQLAYWIGRQEMFELGNVGTHAYSETPANGVDPASFEETWNVLVRRHDMLRMVITADGKQRVLDSVPHYKVKINDFRSFGPEEARQAVLQVRTDMSHQLFSGEEWPLFDLRISLLPEDRAIVHRSLDALMMDASSTMTLFREFVALYAEPTAVLPELQITFRDYVLARERFQQSSLYLSAKNYWTARASNFPSRPDLPLAVDPARISRPRFERRSFTLDGRHWEKLESKARQLNITPTVLFMACFGEVLSRWSQTSRFALNLTLSDRIPFHPNVHDILGDFTTLTLLEVDCQDGVAPFLTRLHTLQKQLWLDLEQRHFDGMEMIQVLRQVKGEVVGFPIVFTSTLGLTNAQEKEVESAQPITNGVGAISNASDREQGYSITQTSQVWLDVQVFERNDGIYFNWDSVVGLFPDGMLEAMVTAFKEFLGRLADSEEAWQLPAKIAPPVAHLQTIEAANATAHTFESGFLHTPLLIQIDKQGDKIAVRTTDKELTFRQLGERSQVLAHRLRAGGASPNRLVAVVMEKGWQQVVAVLGILKAGAAYLPIDASLPLERIDLLLTNAEVCQVVTTPAYLDRIPNSYPDPYSIEDDFVIGASVLSVLPEIAASPEDLAYVIFTSGSTGIPKGVMIEHSAALNTIHDINQRFGVVAGDSVFGLSSLSFDLSVYDIFGVLGAGGTLVLPRPEEYRDPRAWLAYLHRSATGDEVTIWNTVPALMQMLVDQLEDSGVVLDLRLVMMSGDWIPIDLPSRIRAVAPQADIVSLGGATEASIWSITFPINEVANAWKSVPYGKALANQAFYVMQKDLTLCPFWAVGDLYIGGVGLARGYWRDVDKTAASFVRHPVTNERLYKTGDRGRLWPDGNIEFLGREDQQVKLQGFRVELGEIEARLKSHPHVSDAVVTTHAIGKVRFLVAYVVPNASILEAMSSTDGSSQERVLDVQIRLQQEVIGFLQAGLPDYMIPRELIPIPRVPLTQNGKLDRKALPSPKMGASTTREHEAPQGEIEEALAAIWKDLLRVDQVGRNDNFFELGGHSLLAVQVSTRLQRRLDLQISLGEIFARPQLSQLAERILDIQLSEFDSDELLALTEATISSESERVQ